MFLHKKQEPLAQLWEEITQNLHEGSFEKEAYFRGAQDALVYFSELVQHKRLKIKLSH